MEQKGSVALSNLWNQVHQVKAHAKLVGALKSFDTDTRIVTDASIPFIVRYTKALAKKPVGSVRKVDPFDPPEPELFVAHLSDTHSLVLNKFNVLDNHMLMVTRKFESQETHLTSNDLHAAWTIAKGLECLTFYNKGSHSGASQPHKHMQAVPLPLIVMADQPRVPIETIVLNGERTAISKEDSDVFTIDALRWKHACSHFKEDTDHQEVSRIYNKHIEYLETGSDLSYNWMMTDKWMLTVLRQYEHFEAPYTRSVEQAADRDEKQESKEEHTPHVDDDREKGERVTHQVKLSPNTLGFAGTILAKNDIELEFVQQVGPMKILDSLAYLRD